MIIAIAAQKGGVGKSSLTVHLSGVFAENGGKVLLCDIDPQHSLSSTFLDDVYSLDYTVKDLLLDPDISLNDVVQPTKFKGIDIIPSNLSLGEHELQLLSVLDHNFLLSDKIVESKEKYSIILIDSPPSLGLFTTNALVASDYVLIPLECSSYAVKSTIGLLNHIKVIKRRTNPQLKILGFVINRIDARRRIEQDYREVIREQFGDQVFKTELKNNVKFAEAVSVRIPINLYQPKSEQAEACRELYQEIMKESKQDGQKGLQSFGAG